MRSGHSWILLRKKGTGLIKTEGIKNIILDLGGVILELDVNTTIGAFRQLGFPPLDSADIILSKYPFFLDFETGQMSTGEFIDRITEIAQNRVSREEVLKAWNTMIRGFRTETIDLLLELKKKYRLFLLSNTNAIHEVHYNMQLSDQHGIANLDRIFEKVYYSHRLKMRKPDKGIFLHVRDDAGLIPGESLYIDDTQVHVNTARALGFRAYHLADPQKITDLL